uniref:Glutathione S-transferase theta n=1 Tax=Ostrinia furnacalis TaxID=93504 RepID=A0A5B9TM38_OSTFU|nr:glutathione S-transferase theta [Ostrinia furnacalis]QIC35751.1 glutathione S-transferase theta [Ostrinia furnacalis]
MPLKLYYDLMSQPSRTLFILLKKVQCDFEPKYVDLRKAEHYSEEFTNQINRMQRVPVIDHNGFILSESVAIVRYLAQEKMIPESLYPSDSKLRARVDEYLEWQHVGLRWHCAMYFRVKSLEPALLGRQTDEKTLAGYKRRMLRALDDFDQKWLGIRNQFVVGDTLTVADLFAATELEQPRMAGYDPKEHYPAIATWAKKVQEHFNPYYDEAHVTVNKIATKQIQMAKL